MSARGDIQSERWTDEAVPFFVAAEALVKGISGDGVGKAEADLELLHLVPAAASANWDTTFTVEGIKPEALAAEATWWQFALDEVREVPLIHVPSDLELAAGHSHMAEALVALIGKVSIRLSWSLPSEAPVHAGRSRRIQEDPKTRQLEATLIVLLVPVAR